MGYKGFLSVITTVTLLSFLALFFVVTGLSPEKGALSVTVFFLTLFMTLAGVLTIAFFYGKRIFLKDEVFFSNVKVAFRQAFLLSIFITIVLVLKAYKIFFFWDTILLFFSIMLLEFYFRSRNI